MATSTPQRKDFHKELSEMKWIAVQATFEHENISLVTDLIAAAFYDQGVKGVVIDDPVKDPDQDWGKDAVVPPLHHGVTGYFPDNETTSGKCAALERELDRLKADENIHTRITFSRIDEEDWAESWKEFFWPIKITDRIVIKPTWRKYSANTDEIIIEIDPGMAFGTGTHPTTALCIQLIQRYIKPGDTFLDVGTGSGILMIAAAKLGALEIAGIDIEEVAVEVARKNLGLNKIPESKYWVAMGNLADIIKKPYRVVVANILAEVIVDLMDDITGVVADGGVFICSGIIKPKKKMILSALESRGFQCLTVIEEDEWVAIAVENQT